MVSKDSFSREDQELEQLLRERFDYNPDTGVFIWKPREEVDHISKGFNTQFAGKEAGCLETSYRRRGYIRIPVGGRQIQAHRAAWWFCYGYWPEQEIDHINQVRSDNRIENLRLADRGVQNRNSSRRSDNKSNHCGVCWSKEKGKWIAAISNRGKQVYLGQFDNLDDAVSARKEAERRYGYSTQHGANPSRYAQTEEELNGKA